MQVHATAWSQCEHGEFAASAHRELKSVFLRVYSMGYRVLVVQSNGCPGRRFAQCGPAPEKVASGAAVRADDVNLGVTTLDEQ